MKKSKQLIVSTTILSIMPISGCIIKDLDGDGYSQLEGDCDDSNSDINPSAIETCDNIDQNCNEIIDDGLEKNTYYVDNDQDSFGDENDTPLVSCKNSDGYSLNSYDCDDENEFINPNSEEIPTNDIDENCDGVDIGFTFISSFYTSTTAIDDNSNVWEWGYIPYLYQGTQSIYNSSYRQVPNLTDIISLSSGKYFSMALRNDGSLWSWGNNEYGQLGINSSEYEIKDPVKVTSISNINSVSTGYYHVLSSDTNGFVYSWGKNEDGQLGNGNNELQMAPVKLESISNIVSVRAGGMHSLALSSDGSVFAWGFNYSGQLGNGLNEDSNIPVKVLDITNIKYIGAGEVHSLAIDNNGQVYSWGHNYYGQLGDGSKTNSNIPILVPNIQNAVSALGQNSHTLALLSDGRVLSWGASRYGQLGNGSSIDRLYPTLVPNIDNITHIAVGIETSFALTNNGNVMSWGNNSKPQLGGPSSAFNFANEIPEISEVEQISSGFSASFARTTYGDVWGWGDNYWGEIGNEDELALDRYAPVKITSLKNIEDISAGGYHTTALDSNGTVWAWGNNFFGQLATRSVDSSNKPLEVSTPTQITKLSSGAYHTLAIDKFSNVWGWGHNRYGQIGDNSVDNHYTPVKTQVIKNIEVIKAGYQHSLAINNLGELWAWGDNYYGQLGDGTITLQAKPIQITTLPAVLDISAGLKHSMALSTDGNVWIWGTSDRGQLGLGYFNTESLSPTQLTTLSEITSIGAGDFHSFAIDALGNTYGWGSCYYAEAGSNCIYGDNMFSPLLLSEFQDAVQIDGGYDFTLARTSSGRVYGWGSSQHGQVGGKRNHSIPSLSVVAK